MTRLWTLVPLLLAACSSEPPPPAVSPRPAPQPTTATTMAPPPATTMAPTTPPPASTGATADLGQMSNDPETDRRMRTAVVKAVEPGRDRMRVCYNDGLRANSKLKGEVNIKLTVAPSGDPVEITDDGSTVRDKDFVDCIRSVLSKLTYPRWQGKAVTVVVPIEFYRSTDPGSP